MMDVEFTFESGRLYFLQCRVAKRADAGSREDRRRYGARRADHESRGAAARSAAATRRPAAPAASTRACNASPLAEVAQEAREALIDEKPALIFADDGQWRRWTRRHGRQCPRASTRRLLARARFIEIARGLPASPGAAVGRRDLRPGHRRGARPRARRRERVILVREETSPDDMHGMTAAQGILTERGGMSSHAALVARGFGKPCVSGCEAISVDEEARVVHHRRRHRPEGQVLTIDGSTGARAARRDPDRSRGDLPASSTSCSRWADETRRLKVRANADTPTDADKAHRVRREGHRPLPNGAHVPREGTPAGRARDAARGGGCEGLESGGGGAREGARERRRARRRRARSSGSTTSLGRMEGPMGHYLGALERILPMQQGDFEEIFRVDGRQAGDDPPDRPADARVPAGPRRAARGGDAPAHPAVAGCAGAGGAGGDARERERDARAEPDARSARLPARHPLSRDQRDAGEGDLPRRRSSWRAKASRCCRRS